MTVDIAAADAAYDTWEAHPTCPCGQDMVKCSSIPVWECADAFFALHDGGVIDDTGGTPPTLHPGADDWHRQQHAHLLATRIEAW